MRALEFAKCLMTIILIYFTLGDFILVKLGVVSLFQKSDIDILVFIPIIATMIWWIGIQFNRWRLKLWFKTETYIGMLVAVMGAIPLGFVISRLDVGLAIYLPELLIIPICAKITIWGFWLRLISGDNLWKYMHQV